MENSVPAPVRRQRVLRVGVTVLALAAALLLFRACNQTLEDAATPPLDVQTFQQHMAWQPQTDTFFLVTGNDGQQYVEAVGEPARLNAAGPSAYVFDRSGKLVGWTIDTGDDPNYRQKWHGPGARQARPEAPMDRAGVERWLGSSPATTPATGVGPR